MSRARAAARPLGNADCAQPNTLCHRVIHPEQAPDLACLARANPGRYPFLFESSAGAAAQSRYDLLLAFPGRTLCADNPDHPDLFAELEATRRAGVGSGTLPFIGGWFFYIGYEMAASVEPTLCLPPKPDDGLPTAFATRCPAAIIHDRRDHVLHVLSEDDDGEYVAAMCADIHAHRDTRVGADALAADWREQPPERYIDAVAGARELIHAGDVFQVNLSRAWHGQLARDYAPADVYGALRGANPAPFSGLIQYNDTAVACSSPERLFGINGDTIQTRPIAGTRARHDESEQHVIDELLAHPKERAEHVMLIDLERNDLGRVCRSGSIGVSELMVAESYAHVHHIVSNIAGRLRSDVDIGAVIRAVFPGGTITGCPKVRCMQIIGDLEDEGRGPYTGTFGYVSRCGRVDSNIIIRSLTQRARCLTLRTGAGIVADSSPEAELAETRAKARGVLRGFVDQPGDGHD